MLLGLTYQLIRFVALVRTRSDAQLGADTAPSSAACQPGMRPAGDGSPSGPGHERVDVTVLPAMDRVCAADGERAADDHLCRRLKVGAAVRGDHHGGQRGRVEQPDDARLGEADGIGQRLPARGPGGGCKAQRAASGPTTPGRVRPAS